MLNKITVRLRKTQQTKHCQAKCKQRHAHLNQ